MRLLKRNPKNIEQEFDIDKRLLATTNFEDDVKIYVGLPFCARVEEDGWRSTKRVIDKIRPIELIVALVSVDSSVPIYFLDFFPIQSAATAVVRLLGQSPVDRRDSIAVLFFSSF